MTELIPTKATFAPGEPIEVEVRGDAATVSLWRLERKVAEVEPLDGIARFAAQPEGGYGVEGGGATSAFDVLADPLSRAAVRLRRALSTLGRQTEGVIDNVRRLHLNAVQFYDWMYRHADLVPPTDDFEDALGQTTSLDTVRRLATAIGDAGSAADAPTPRSTRRARKRGPSGSSPKGSSAPTARPGCSATSSGTSTRRAELGVVAALRRRAGRSAVRRVGFEGLHLDQYGDPKRALRKDGTVVDLEEAFPALHRAVRRASCPTRR